MGCMFLSKQSLKRSTILIRGARAHGDLLGLIQYRGGEDRDHGHDDGGRGHESANGHANANAHDHDYGHAHSSALAHARNHACPSNAKSTSAPS